MELISNYTKYRRTLIWFSHGDKIFRYAKLFEYEYGVPFIQTKVSPTTFNCWVNEGELEKLSK